MGNVMALNICDNRPRIAVMLPADSGHFARVRRGIAAWGLMQSPRWRFVIITNDAQARRCLDHGDLSGAILAEVNSNFRPWVVRRGIPCVVVTDRANHELPHIRYDDHAIGRLAAEHLRGNGLKHLACLHSGARWALDRAAGFADGAGTAVWRLSHDPRRPPADLATRLAQLPRPCGLFAVNDLLAMHALDAAQLASLSVPEELALLGCDDDDGLLPFASPTLSSIDPGATALGRAAAKLLGLMLTGKTADEPPVLPLRVVVRASTGNNLATTPELCRALSLLRQPGRVPRVSTVAAACGLGRRTLERQIRRLLGHSPLMEYHATCIRRAQALLAESGLPLGVIASRCGFTDHAAMSRRFRQRTGYSPSAYRDSLAQSS